MSFLLGRPPGGCHVSFGEGNSSNVSIVSWGGKKFMNAITMNWRRPFSSCTCLNVLPWFMLTVTLFLIKMGHHSHSKCQAAFQVGKNANAIAKCFLCPVSGGISAPAWWLSPNGDRDDVKAWQKRCCYSICHFASHVASAVYVNVCVFGGFFVAQRVPCGWYQKCLFSPVLGKSTQLCPI